MLLLQGLNLISYVLDFSVRLGTTVLCKLTKNCSPISFFTKRSHRLLFCILPIVLLHKWRSLHSGELQTMERRLHACEVNVVLRRKWRAQLLFRRSIKNSNAQEERLATSSNR